jgi:hypothetical protein
MIELGWQLLSSFWDFVGILILILLFVAAVSYFGMFLYCLIDLYRLPTRWERMNREADDD